MLLEGNLEKTENQYVYVRSGRLTQNRVLEILERESRETWTVVPSRADALRLQGVAIWDKWTKQEGKSPKELSDNAEFQMGVGMMVGGLIMGTWGVFEDKAKHWMDELGLAEEDLDAVLSQATREIVSASA